MNWITAQNDDPADTLVSNRDVFQPLEELGILPWLDALSRESIRRYARKEGEPLKMQTGHAWSTLRARLQKRSELEVVQLLGALLRYANTDRDRPSRLLFSAYVPLSLEHEAFSEYIGFETLGKLTSGRRSIVLVRRTLRRWCEWLESLAHWEAHSRLRQSNTRASEFERILILLWPLARKNQWTLSELLAVMCLISRRPPRWFCQYPDDLGPNLRALGLPHKTGAYKPDLNPPRGSSVALRYSHFWTTSAFQSRTLQIP